MSSPNHVLLYGPPAAGKLTVANRLAELYQLHVLDNHASIDPALRLFPFGTSEFVELVEQLRVALIAAAAKADLDIVTTLVYADGEDDKHVERLAQATERHGGVVHRVQLHAPREVLCDRLGHPSRIGTQKMTDTAQLGRFLTRYDTATPMPGTVLQLDTNQYEPDQVVNTIGKQLNLRPRT